MEQGRGGDQGLEMNGGRSTDEISPPMETSCSDTETSAGSKKRNFSENTAAMPRNPNPNPNPNPNNRFVSSFDDSSTAKTKKARMAAELQEALHAEVKGEPEMSKNCQAPPSPPPPDKNDLIAAPNSNNGHNGHNGHNGNCNNNGQIVRKARVSVRARCEAPMVTN